MEIRTLIIVAIIIVVAVIAYFLLTSRGSAAQKTTTIVGPVNGTTSMTVPPYVTTYNSVKSNNMTNITGVNIKVDYTGPAQQNGAACSRISTASAQSSKGRFNANANFSYYFYMYSTTCNFTITSVGIDNNGFKILYVQPTLPYLLPSYSNIQMSVGVKSPNYNFTGPLSITVYAK